jgi:hypothetical protein
LRRPRSVHGPFESERVEERSSPARSAARASTSQRGHTVRACSPHAATDAMAARPLV